MRFVVVLALVALGSSALSIRVAQASSSPDKQDSSSGKSTLSSPIFSQPPDVCLSSDEAADIDAKIVTLERDLKVAKAKARRFGGVLGCGVGIGAQVDKGQATLDAVPFCGAVFGWRF